MCVLTGVTYKQSWLKAGNEERKIIKGLQGKKIKKRPKKRYKALEVSRR